jgi:hypothetical protein
MWRRARSFVRGRTQDPASELAATRGALEDLQRQLQASHQDVFEWSGELSAKCGELAAQINKVSIDLSAEVSAAKALASTQMNDLHIHLARAQDEFNEAIERVRRIAMADFDNLFFLRRQLTEARRSPEYAEAFDTPEPLVSVCISTYNRGAVLVGRTLPSVFAQTYEPLEVIVVGDHCTDNTESLVEQLGDPRVRFVNLPHQGVYPVDPVHRWMVAGTPPQNFASELSRGHWIATLDDDDEFSPDHIELLLGAARRDRNELVYGRLRQLLPASYPVRDRVIGAYPPEDGQFNFSGAMYLRVLQFYEHDPHAWVTGEVGDWLMCRRMLDSGVRIGFVDDVVATLHVTGPRTVGD